VTNAVGNPLRVWDSRDHVVSTKYDGLLRRTDLRVKTCANAEVLAEQTIYGETLPTPEVTNHRGKVYQVKDGAGVVTSVEYDFKGNLLEAHRQLAAAFSGQLDWSQSVALDAETFVKQTQYDALNRPTSMEMPYVPNTPNKPNNIVKPFYNEAGLLERVEAFVRGAASATVFVDDIDYDAKGQREKIVYGNGIESDYEYDEFTFRVKLIRTRRTADNTLLQDLRYFYDAVGNIVEMADLAHASFTHGGELIEPVWKYEYDAIYRLIHATGREHAGQNADIQQDAFGFPLVNAPSPNDPQAMRNYAETYQYDAVGNILAMIHASTNTGSWTRRYQTSTTSNRLLATSNALDAPNQFSDAYPHDDHDNMLAMSHLQQIAWGFKDQMQHVHIATGQDVYFTYDASGQRVRKVWVHNGITEERIYLGGFEIYRRHENGGVVVERETLHIMDDAQRIAMVETKTVDTSVPNLNVVSRIRYQCSNHLGSATLEVDEFGAVISYEEYHPYGTSAYRATNGSVEVSARRYRYTGKERDEETGLYYHGARYYACWLGRWTAADPAGMVDGPNLFQYVRGRPIGSIDPHGTESLELKAGYPSIQDRIAAAAPQVRLKLIKKPLESPQETPPPTPTAKEEAALASLPDEHPLPGQVAAALRQLALDSTLDVSPETLQAEFARIDEAKAEVYRASLPPSTADKVADVIVDLTPIREASDAVDGIRERSITKVGGAVFRAAIGTVPLSKGAKFLGILRSVKALEKEKKVEKLIRYTSLDEATEIVKKEGLSLRKGHRGPKRVAESTADMKPKKLGSPAQYSHKVEMTVKSGTLKWLRQWPIEGEPGRYAIPAELVEQFNKDMLLELVITKVR